MAKTRKCVPLTGKRKPMEVPCHKCGHKKKLEARRKDGQWKIYGARELVQSGQENENH